MSLAIDLELEAAQGQPVLTWIGCGLVGSSNNCRHLEEFQVGSNAIRFDLLGRSGLLWDVDGGGCDDLRSSVVGRRQAPVRIRGGR